MDQVQAQVASVPESKRLLADEEEATVVKPLYRMST